METTTASATTEKSDSFTRRATPAPCNPAGYRRCVRCIMDTSDPEIAFNSKGICNHCDHYDHRMQTEYFSGDEQSLCELVKQIQSAGRGKDYDCVIGVSGGMDSTYVAYTIRKLGLRPLAVHLDNGWNSELAVANIERTVSTLNIDLYTHVVDWEEFRDLHLAFLKASVANSEVPTDHAIVALLYREASKRNIRFIIGGGNLATESVMPKCWMYDAKDLRHLKDIHRQFGSIPLRTFPTFTLSQFAYWTFVKGIRTVPILNYVSYVKREAAATLESQLGWRSYGGKHFESLYTKWFQAYILPRKFSIDKRLAHLSSLVLSGQLTREQALELMKQPLYEPNQLREDTDFLLKKLGLTAQTLDEILAAPVKSYRDYKSNAYILRGMPRAIDFVKRIATNRPRRAA